MTIATSNVSIYAVGSYKARALSALLQKEEFAGAMFWLNMAAVVADSGATQIFVMEGRTLSISAAQHAHSKWNWPMDSRVVSTHMCNNHIDGLPFVLTGHIIPDLSIALLFEIRILTEVGCNINFDKHKCTVWATEGVRAYPWI